MRLNHSILLSSLIFVFFIGFYSESYAEEIEIIDQTEFDIKSKSILFQNQQMIDGFGNEINSGIVGKKVHFSALIKNLESTELTFVFAMIAKNDQGEIEHESWFTGILNPDQSIEPTISTWTIPSYGDYVVSLELWNNPIDRDLLVDSFIIPISIQKQIESNNDVTPPEISIPPNITRVVNNPDGSVVQFYASVYDDVDQYSAASCSPPSDSLFQFGTTTVVCTSIDSSGNISEESFTITLEYREFPALTHFKERIKLWSINELNDSDFGDSVETLAERKILTSSNFVVDRNIVNCTNTKFSPLDNCKVPSWVKNVVKWWSENKISDIAFFQMLEYLIEKNFITTTHITSYLDHDALNSDSNSSNLSKKIIPHSNFAVAGDFGVSKETENTIRNIVSHSPELILIPGDINHYEPGPWMYSTNELFAGSRVLPAIGNHELDRGFPSHAWLEMYHITSDFYTQKFENTLFISLSTEGSYLPQSEQIKFLEKSLKHSSDNPDIDWVIVFFHRPIYTDGKNSPQLEFRKMVQPLFDKFGVDLVLQGHNHIYERTASLKFDSVLDPNGQVYATVGTGGFSHEPFLNKSDWSLFQNNLDFGFLNLQLILDGKKIRGDFISNSGETLDSFELCSSKIYEKIISYEELKGKDLMCSDLSGIDLSEKDLSGTKLSGANLAGATLSGVDLSGLDLSYVNLSNTDLSGKDLSGTKLLGVNLVGTNLSGVDLSGLNLIVSNLSGADLSGKDLSGTKLRGANLAGANLSDVDLSGLNLSNVNLSGVDLSGIDLSDVSLFYATSFESNLSGIKFSDHSINMMFMGSDLSHADFSNVQNLMRKDFRNTDLTGVDFSGRDLSYVNFKDTTLKGVNFENALLFGASFNRANLEDANFSNSTISGALFWNANLKNANMSNSIIKDSDFNKANLENVNLLNAEIDDSKFNCRNHSICD